MEWIKFKCILDDAPNLYLPEKLIRGAGKLGERTILRFGLKEMKVRVIIGSHPAEAGEPADLVTVPCSRRIVDELLIIESLTYQMMISGGEISVGPVIGLLMGEQHYYYHDRYLKECRDYMESYERTGGLVIVFKPHSMDWGTRCIHGLYYDGCSKTWKYGKLPFPSVIFRRAFQHNEAVVERLKEVTGGRVFNSVRLDKWQIYKSLQDNSFLGKFLPHTEKLDTLMIAIKFLNRYPRVILKPAELSRSRGICVVQKKDDRNFIVYDYRKLTKSTESLKSFRDLQEFLVDGGFIRKNYIIQPYLNLATICGSPFDIRIVMQKDRDERWNCTGIECRLARPKGHITNIARGGTALSLHEAVNMAFDNSLAPEKVYEDITGIALDFCSYMDKTGELFAEFGLDIGIDSFKNYWFIEANVRPTFKGFKLMDYNIYRQLCCNPISFAAYMAGF